MSWSVSVPPQPFERFLKAVEQARIDDSSNKPELVAQWTAQLDAAKRAVYAMFSPVDVFGRGEATFSATMGGHANHDGAGEGTTYTDYEFINITVTRIPKTGTEDA